MKNVAIIGAGASGLMAAYAAGCQGAKVTVFEKNEKAGKKIYITGKGRCNVTNACDPRDFQSNVVTNPKFMYKSFSAFSNKDVVEFIEKNGTPLKVERGNRVFPVSDHASDITKALVNSLRGLNVNILYEKKADKIITASLEDGKRYAKGIRIGKEDYSFDSVIVASGGASYPGAGGCNFGYEFAEKLGVKVVEPIPSLVPFLLKEDYIKELQGLSLRNVELVIRKNHKIVYKEFGELLFTHFGISGPLVLTASAYLARSIKDGGEFTGSINLKPAIPEKELDLRLLDIIEKNNKKQFKSFFEGLVPGKLRDVMVELSGIAPDKRIGEINKEERKKIFKLIRELPFTVLGTRGFSEAIITKGGVDVKEINPSTMEVKSIKGLYFCGEVLDIDALTGGFNLQCAFSTGYVAGACAGKEE